MHKEKGSLPSRFVQLLATVTINTSTARNDTSSSSSNEATGNTTTGNKTTDDSRGAAIRGRGEMRFARGMQVPRNILCAGN